MQASGIRSHGLAATIAAAFLIVCSTHLPAAVIPFDLQESQASLVAASERDFDRLDNGAGLRSGGAFPFDYQQLVFFDLDEQGKPVVDARVWTAASVQAGRLRGYFDDGWNYNISMMVELFDADTLVARTETRHEFVMGMRVDSNEEKGFPVHTLLRVPAGVYDYHIRIQSAGAWNPASDVKLKLNAARIVQKDARPFVYFEAYGLTPGSSYRGEIRLVSRWVSRGQGEEFNGTYEPFQMQYRGNVPVDPSVPVRKLLRLDLQDTEPGPYEVQIRVRDLETGLVSEVRSARLKVQGAERYRRLVPTGIAREQDQ